MTWLGNGLRARSLCPVRRWRAVSDGSAARGAKEAGVLSPASPASTAAGRSLRDHTGRVPDGGRDEHRTAHL